MSKSPNANISGILDRILSPSNGERPEGGDEDRTVNPQTACPLDAPGNDFIVPLTEKKLGARRGRPLGKSREPKERKEKVTVWLNDKLIAYYRDWSWEARCQLSTLVESALVEYRTNQRNRGDISR